MYSKCSDYNGNYAKYPYDWCKQNNWYQGYYQSQQKTQQDYQQSYQPEQQQYYSGDKESDKDDKKDEDYETGSSYCPEEKQTHTHEFELSTKLAEECNERHNHRSAGVTGQAIPIGCGNHKHEIFTRTDFFDHFHFIKIETGPAIPVGCGKHVHFVKGYTSVNDGHFHEFAFATLIDAPLLPLA
jgi:hypothetical protein